MRKFETSDARGETGVCRLLSQALCVVYVWLHLTVALKMYGKTHISHSQDCTNEKGFRNILYIHADVCDLIILERFLNAGSG